jgi:hypothetical protein
VSVLLQGLRIQEYRRPHSAHSLVLTGEAGVHIQVSSYATLELIIIVIEETLLLDYLSLDFFVMLFIDRFLLILLLWNLVKLFFCREVIILRALYWCE